VSDSSPILILTGATASGKTELALELAERYDAEIVGADSRQIYRDMPIGTAAPTADQVGAAPHHLIGFLDPQERYSAARYARDALAVLDGIRQRGKRAIVAGGTGFYIRALTGGVSLAPHFDENVRERLAYEARVHRSAFLHRWLELRDPMRARALDPNDTYRVLRALEIVLSGPAAAEPPARTLRSDGAAWELVFLDVPLPTLDERIERRAAEMLDRGLLEEAERIGSGAVAANAVGYPQASAFLRGWSTSEELRASLARATRRYARRQRAWFRNERDVRWTQPHDVDRLVREKLRWLPKRV
jgi:tRNA dimethylallyltransferase